jgi:hypothetical protein
MLQLSNDAIVLSFLCNLLYLVVDRVGRSVSNRFCSM